jgi:hypothetical protein
LEEERGEEKEEGERKKEEKEEREEEKRRKINGGVIEVQVKSAQHLPQMDLFGTCDVFCEFFWLGKHHKTSINTQRLKKKGDFFPYLVGNLAPLPLYAFHLFIELFAGYRSLDRWIHHDDDALCTSYVLYFVGLLVISACQTRLITLYRPSFGL